MSSSTMNPLKRLRLNAGLTQKVVAEQCDITPQTVLRAEQGLFTTVPSSLLSFYGDGVKEQNSILEEYFAWIRNERATRRLSERFFLPLQYSWSRIKSIGGGSSAGVAKLLVVQQSIIYQFEKGWLRGEGDEGYRTVTDALKECGAEGVLVR